MSAKMGNGVVFKNLHFVLDIPDDLVIETTRLRDDVSLWAKLELKGDYCLVCTYLAEIGEDNQIRMFFQHEMDMLHFKMRWVGSPT